MLGFTLVMTRVYAIYMNPRKEHDIEHDDGSYGSCCSTKFSTLVEDTKSGANALHYFLALFFWDVRQGKDHGGLEFLIIHGGIGACDDARVEDLGFEESNPKMDM
jgi:hypothetical protein